MTNRGGLRPGAGAPKGNLNRYIHGRRSARRPRPMNVVPADLKRHPPKRLPQKGCRDLDPPTVT